MSKPAKTYLQQLEFAIGLAGTTDTKQLPLLAESELQIRP